MKKLSTSEVTPGSGDVHLDTADLDGRYLQSNGDFNITVTGALADGSSAGSYNMTLHEDRRHHLSPAGSSLGQFGEGSAVKVDLGMDPTEGTVTTLAEPLQGETHNLAPLSVHTIGRVGMAAHDAATPSLSDGCHWVATNNVKNGVPQYWAPVYGWAGAKGIAKVTVSSRHTVGVGQQTGGGWTHSGTNTVTAGDQATSNPLVDQWAANRINYREFRNTCSIKQWRPTGDNAILDAHLQSHAQHQYYGTGSSHVGRHPQCQAINPTGSYVKSTARATTYDAAINLGFINLSSQAGWDSNTEISWTATANSWICGDTQAGPASSARVDVRKR